MPKMSDSSYPKLTGVARNDRIHAEDMSQADPAQVTRYLEVQDLLAGTLGYASMAVHTTMTGNLTLLNTDAAYRSLNPNGANRNVTLPTVGADNHPYLIRNESTSAYTLTVLWGTMVIAVLRSGESVLILSDGVAWYAYGESLYNGWVNPNETWTYVSASSFRVTGDRRSTYKKGTKLWWTQSGVQKWAVVVSSTYSSPYTTVNIFINTDYVIANATITGNYYSYIEDPAGFPDQFNFAVTWIGLTAGNAVVVAKCSLTPSVCKGFVSLTYDATSPTTSITGAVSINPPVTPLLSTDYLAIGAVALVDTGVALYMGEAVLRITGVIDVRVINASGTYAVWGSISSAIPFAWGASDLMTIDFEFLW